MTKVASVTLKKEKNLGLSPVIKEKIAGKALNKGHNNLLSTLMALYAKKLTKLREYTVYLFSFIRLEK